MLVSKLSIVAMATVLTAGSAMAQLPDGAGKVETEKVCTQCHELARAISLREDRAGWQNTLDKMISLGAKATPEQFQLIVDYLSANFPADPLPKIDMNTARAIDLEAALSLRRSQAALVIEYRTKHGRFNSLEDVKNVPGVDFSRFLAKKDRLTF